MPKTYTLRQRVSSNGSILLPQEYRSNLTGDGLVDIRVLGDTIVISRPASTFTRAPRRFTPTTRTATVERRERP